MSWDDAAATWDDDPAVRAYAEGAFASLETFLAAQGTSLAGQRVLDFGCGTGRLTAAMAATAREVVGLDVSPAMIEVLVGKSIDNVRALSGAVADHALGRFNVVTASSVCAFLDDYPGTARQLAALLRPGGWFVQWDWELDPDEEEPYGLTSDGIRAALEGAGLQQVDVRTGFELPFGEVVMRPLMGTGRAPMP